MAKKPEIVKEIREPVPKDFQEISSSQSPLYDKSQLKPYNPATLYQKKDWDVYDNMREDDQISACLKLKKYIILSNEWEIETEHEEIKEFLEWNLNERLQHGLMRSLWEMLTALDYGVSLNEKIFAYQDNKIIIHKIATRPPHSYYLHTDEFGTLTKIEQYRQNGYNAEYDPKKFIVFTYQEEFGNPWGNADLNKAVYRSWWSKEAIIKFWNIALERYGTPLIVGYYPNNARSLKSDMITVFKNLQAKTGIAVPEVCKIDVLNAARQGEAGFEKAIDKHNTLIARSMLLPDLSGMSGSETGGGSYSLGKEQFGMFYLAIEAIRKQIEAVVNKHLIQPLVTWNFGDKEVKWSFKRIDDSKKEQQMNMFLTFLEKKVLDPNIEQLNHFFNAIDFPEVDEQEWEERKAQKEEQRQAFLNGNVEGNKKEDQEKVVKKDNPEKPVKKEVKKNVKKKEYQAYYRKLTEYEKKTNFKEIETKENELTEKYVKVLGEKFSESINKLFDYITSKKIIENKKLNFIPKLRLTGLKSIEKVFRDMLKDGRSLGDSTVERPKNYEVITPKGTLDFSEVADWIDINAQYLTDVEAQNILKIVSGSLQDGIRSGASVSEIVKMINEDLKGYDIKFEPYRLENIVRTNVHKALMEERLYQFNELKDEIIGYQYSAILDHRTSDICLELDGKVFTPSEANYYNPPIHYQCRSILVPIFQGEALGAFDIMPETERQKGGFLKLSG